ncbi:MAG: cobalt transporter [Caulobacterales bacterium RIFOXYB1_FULL_67_16]|jgi:cobalt-zinc-cadmium efflux system protein|nr:MAG: cobalt transporter [Caulobacterales bacterium RIFOXYB1_FULL_67_16]
MSAPHHPDHAGHDHGHDHDHGHAHGRHHHGHSHGHGHAHGPVDTGDWRYAVGLVVNLAFVVCEFAAGLIADSTALLADAGHNLSDVLGLAMAGGAAWLARKGGHGAAGGRRTYGFGKATVLAALANALLLIFACGAIAFEAARRFAEPAPVGSGVIMTVAALGFVINLGTALLFMKSQHDLNARGAYLHMMADAGVSLGVVLAGGLILLTGWSLVDPIVSLVIVAVILWSTWGLLKDSVNLAIDGAPGDVDLVGLEQALAGLDGVREVHDLHVWGLSTTETALTAHLVHDRADGAALLMEAQAVARRHSISHTTLQLENEALPDCPGC